MQKKVLPIIFATLLLDMVGTGMIIPIVPIIFTDPSSSSFLLTGYSTAAQFFIAGLLTAVFGFMQFIAAPILGELSDIYGRKRLLAVGVATLAGAQMLFGAGVAMGTLWLLFVSRAIAGIAGGNIGIAQATIADVTDPKDRAKNFGLIGAAIGIGFVLGPLLSGYIASTTGDASAPFWFAGFLGILNMFSVTFFLRETHTTRTTERKRFTLLRGIHNIREAFLDPEARPVYGASFLFMSGFAFFTSFSGVLLVARYGFDEADIGAFFGIVGIWIVITQVFILRVLTRIYSERQILRVTLCVLAASLTLYPFMPQKEYLFLLLPFLTIPIGLTNANMSALVSRSVSSGRQGAALGINASLLAFAQGVAPLVAGIGSGFIAIEAPFIAGALLVLCAWGLLFMYQHKA